MVVEVKVRRTGGAHLRYDKKFELYLGGVGKAAVGELVESIYTAIEGSKEATVEVHLWGGYAYWKLVDEASMLRFAKLEMKAPNGLSMRVEISKQTREAKEKKRKIDSRQVTPGVGVQLGLLIPRLCVDAGRAWCAEAFCAAHPTFTSLRAGRTRATKL